MLHSQHMYLVIHWTLSFWKSTIRSKLKNALREIISLITACLLAVLGIDKLITTRKEIKYYKVKSVNVLNMASDIRKGFTDSSTKSSALENKVTQFESILKSSLDDHAPVKTKLMPLWKPIPWFTEEVKMLKQAMWRREKNLEDI